MCFSNIIPPILPNPPPPFGGHRMALVINGLRRGGRNVVAATVPRWLRGGSAVAPRRSRGISGEGPVKRFFQLFFSFLPKPAPAHAA